MPPTPSVVQKPQRWDVPFGPDMTDPDVDRLLTTAPFKTMDPSRFRKDIPLRGILRNDTRIRKYSKGEIVFRKGDYGTSAVLIMAGGLRAVIEPDLPASVVGRQVSRKKGLRELVAQLWSTMRATETRSRDVLEKDPRTVARQQEGGEVRILLQDVPGVLKDYETKFREPGLILGELGALTRMPRAVTVFADVDDTELLEIRWQGLRDLMKNDDAIQKHMEDALRRFALDPFLHEIPIFSHLSDDLIQKVMDATEFLTVGDYQWSGKYKQLAQEARLAQEPVIAAEGDYPNGVIVVRAGFARLSQRIGNGNRTLSYLGLGHVFGFREIAHNWRTKGDPVPLQQTLRGLGYTHLLVIPTAIMEEIVLPSLPASLLPPLIESNEAPIQATLDEEAVAKLGADLVEFVSENRFYNGKASMLINLDLCTRCDDCVRACAQTHDNSPRFLRHGPTSAKIMVANACMHCVDPVCMIGCPTGAIHRNAAGGEVIINQVTCIGCEICANNCPYDAIRMVAVRDDKGDFMKDETNKAIVKATKCDLCVEQYSGPACQQACPHGALVRVDMTKLDTLADWLKR